MRRAEGGGGGREGEREEVEVEVCTFSFTASFFLSSPALTVWMSERRNMWPADSYTWCRVRDTGYREQNTGYRIQDTE